MPADANAQGAVHGAVQALVPFLIWFWMLGALSAGGYAFRLWRRARRDLVLLYASGVNGALAHSARGNVRRARIRTQECAALALIAACALALRVLPPGLAAEVVRLVYVLLVFVVVALIWWQSNQDERHDRTLRVLLRLEHPAAAYRARPPAARTERVGAANAEVPHG